MAGFIFDPSKGETPESLRRRRDIADALLAGRTAPRNVGEGLSELGNALAYRAVMGKVRKGEEYGQGQEADARAAVLKAARDIGGAQAPAPAAASPAAPMAPQAASQGSPTVDQMTSYIQQAAQSRSIDPQTAVRVAKAEGLQPGVWQSNVMNDGQREQSYGPFQLYMGGGLGNEFQQQTGLDPRDQSTWRQQIDFSLDKAKQGGWGPWNGAKAIGLDEWAGLKQPGGQSLRDGVRAAYATLNPSSGQPAPQASQAQQGGVSLPQLIEIAQNPWADETTKGIAMSLIQQQLAQAKPMSAMERAQLEKTRIETENLRNPRMSPADQARIGLDRERFKFEQGQSGLTDDLREYDRYAEQETKAGRKPMGVMDFMTQLKRAGAASTTVTVGDKEVDKDYAGRLNDWRFGGSADASKQIAQLESVIGMLEDPNSNLTGPGLSIQPDKMLALTNPNAIAARDRVEEVLQRSLRTILGAQFTEKEGERLIARGYNFGLDEGENVKRLRALAEQLKAAKQAQDDAARYYSQNGTLQGWQGRLPAISDFAVFSNERSGNDDINALVDKYAD